MRSPVPIDLLPLYAERRAGNITVRDGNARSLVVDSQYPDPAYGTFKLYGPAMSALTEGMTEVNTSFMRWVVWVYLTMRERGWPVNLALEQLAAYEADARLYYGDRGVPPPVMLQ